MKPISAHNTSINKLTTQLLVATLFVAGVTTYISINSVSTTFEAGTSGKEVTVVFVPAQQTAAPGSTISLTPFVTGKTNKAGFLSLLFTYDSTKIRYQGTIDDTSLSPSIEMISPPEISQNSIRLTYALKNPNIPPEESIQLSTLPFTVITTSPTFVQLDTEHSQVILLNNLDGVIKTNNAFINTPAK